LLAPPVWPETPGFDSAPLRWRSEQLNLISYAIDTAPGRLGLLLLERAGPPEESFNGLARAAAVARSAFTAAGAEVVEKIRNVEPSCSVSAATWEGDRLRLAGSGDSTLPYVLRAGRPIPFPAASGAFHAAEITTAPGDLLVLASSGLGAIVFPTRPMAAEKTVQHFGRRAAEGATLPAAFARLVSEWKKAGAMPGSRDVLLLAARRM
jgi:hypothetical protein